MQLSFHINTRGKLVDKPIISLWHYNAMLNPIRRSYDYQRIARKVFSVEPLPLPPGALSYYDRDIDVANIVSQPSVRIDNIAKRKFNIIDRGINKLRISCRGKLEKIRSWLNK